MIRITEMPNYKKGDYIKDGLLFCGNCNTQKQVSVKLFGAYQIMPCLCECGKAKCAKESQEIKEMERRIYISNLRSEGIQDKSLRDKTFASDDGASPRYAKTINRYVSKWEQVKSENIGLLLWGDVGTGKTFYAACIANHLIDKGVPVMMTDFRKVVNHMSKNFGEERERFLKEMNGYDLIVVDDLGVERQTEFVQEQVYDFIDSRYKAGKPIVITTNLTLDEIKNASDMMLKRIYDRVQEMCVPVKFEGQSRRQAVYSKKIDRMKSLLIEE